MSAMAVIMCVSAAVALLCVLHAAGTSRKTHGMMLDEYEKCLERAREPKPNPDEETDAVAR